MPSTLVEPRRAVAGIFNSAIASAAIGAAWEVGLLDELRTHKKVNVDQFATQHDLDPASTRGLATALAVVEVVRHDHDNNTVLPGILLDEAYRNKSLFHWLSLGSGGLFSRMQYVVRNENREGSFYSRDAAAIAYACRDINREHFDPVFWAAMEGLNYKFHQVVDLGSGSGERLMQILDRYPGTSAIGVDVAGPAVSFAAEEAQRRGFSDRLSFTEGDAREMAFRDEFEDVDLLTCFMMGHDFWPRANCIATLQRLRKAFPKARRFLLGDTTRLLLDSPRSRFAVTEDDVPIFTMGFELAHAMMGVYLPTMEEWEGVFAESGWRCLKTHLIKSSYLSVIFELEQAS